MPHHGSHDRNSPQRSAQDPVLRSHASRRPEYDRGEDRERRYDHGPAEKTRPQTLNQTSHKKRQVHRGASPPVVLVGVKNEEEAK
jgi:hypothetical protein